MNQIMNMHYHEFVQHLFRNTLPPISIVPKTLVREHGGTFDTLETTLFWMYRNRHILQHRNPLEMLLNSPFFFQCHDHWIDIKLENEWEKTEIIKPDVFLEMEADMYNHLTFD
jgi:hypothetical protein